MFLPYLTGERTPHADPDARGVFFGLTLRHGKSHLIRSILDELVMVGPQKYLGKVHMRRGRDWKLAGYFALRPSRPAVSQPDELRIWESGDVAEEPPPVPRRRQSRRSRTGTGPA